MTTIARLLRNEDGATAIEYGLIVAMVALILTASLNAIAGGLTGVATLIAGTVADAACGGAPCIGVSTRWVP